MNPPRLPDDKRKVARLTVVTTAATMGRLERAAAYAGLSKSEFAAGVIERGLEGMPGVGDAEIEEAARRQDDWRERMGL